eukprot:TRINITY_DN16151_c0_g2_i1.p1 TRINITY_DN16151_c0_g2~~TRINITY_DN16151_c0_g2_i1.p1  ORF type:complete len:134 (-),score=26.06 TRINITY_DN16151_c0_g2_i1:4-405(-)
MAMEVTPPPAEDGQVQIVPKSEVYWQRWRQTAELFQQLVHRQAQLHGPTHVATAISQRWLANAYVALEQYHPARFTLYECLDVLEKQNLPVKLVASSQMQLLNILLDSGLISEALKYESRLKVPFKRKLLKRR